MIHIPAYWSFDPKRDIRWDAIASLHRARVPGRQGSALAENLADRMKAAEKLPHLDKEALRLGLKGEKSTSSCALVLAGTRAQAQNASADSGRNSRTGQRWKKGSRVLPVWDRDWGHSVPLNSGGPHRPRVSPPQRQSRRRSRRTSAAGDDETCKRKDALRVVAEDGYGAEAFFSVKFLTN
jgi:hypothetical protein